jgi:NAD(P)-dependent dehydrogenase (short-subunit alcohol dehydrogenase family)
MKILMIGGTGTIGKAVTTELGKRHQVIRVGNKSGELQVDITSASSIEDLFSKVGAFDALVSATGGGHWGPFAQMREADFYKGIQSKMMGQINLVLIGQRYINPKGSFTLTSGILADEPVRDATNLTVINAAIHAFVMAAATELENNVRINVVSPGVVKDSAEKYGPLFPGHIPVAMNRVTAAYVKSIESRLTGQVFRVY